MATEKALQEIHKEILYAEDEGKHSHRNMGINKSCQMSR
jgi:hypothetical protein